MSLRNKILLGICACLVAITAFFMSTINDDRDSVIEAFKSTTDGSYYKKHLNVNTVLSEESRREFLEKQQTSQGNNSSGGNIPDYSGVQFTSTLPDDLSPASITAWVEQQDICKERKELIKKAVSIVGECSYTCNSEAHMNYRKDDIKGLIIECSGFVAWSHRMIGMDVLGAGTTGEMAGVYQLINNPLPGDVGIVKREERGDGASAGHTGIYLGKQANGDIVYVHATGSSKTKDPTPQIRGSNSITTWGHIYRHPDMKAFDDAYNASK